MRDIPDGRLQQRGFGWTAALPWTVYRWSIAMMIEEYFKEIASLTALMVEAAAVAIVAFGAVQAFLRVLGLVARVRPELPATKDVWLHFAAWIVIALEFALAADIIRTAISPTWNDIGQLAAIATIRTVLNFYLEKDIDAVLAKPAEGDRASVA
jgi:uncharacterized membrane protein